MNDLLKRLTSGLPQSWQHELKRPHRIRLMTIDAEGHDPAVLRGAQALLARDHPTLIVETGSSEVVEYLRGFGYTSEKLPGSPTTRFRWLPG